MLVDYYSNYLKNSSFKNLKKFIDYAFFYDFKNYEKDIKSMLELFIDHDYNSKHKYFNLQSNGSSGLRPTNYEIGPNPCQLINYFESKQVCQDRSFKFIKIHLKSCYPNEVHYKALDVSNNGRIFYDINIKSCISVYYLCKVLKSYKPNIILEAPSNIILALSNYDVFLSTCNEQKITIVNTGVELFFKRNFDYIIDRMIDWKTGVNFHTCKYGNYHLVPIFYQDDKNDFSLNLLNLKNKQFYEKSDNIEFNNPKMCQCGAYYFDLNFTPHFKNTPSLNEKSLFDLNLINELESKLINFQVIQIKDHINIFFETLNGLDLIESDVNLIKKRFGVNLNFFKNKCYKIGTNKIPTYWNISHHSNI